MARLRLALIVFFWLTACAPMTIGTPTVAPTATAPPTEPSARVPRTFIIAPDGSDHNTGTLEKPFATIQRCASVAHSGDSCLARAGTYRETITPARSGTASAPITFAPYQNEIVTINGTDAIIASAWTLDHGSVYKTHMAWDLGDGANQVFVDGQMLIEARWPQPTSDIMHPTVATVDKGSLAIGTQKDSYIATISSIELPVKPDGYWVGAMIHLGPGNMWTSVTGKITESQGKQLTFVFEIPNSNQSDILNGKTFTPTSGNPFFLFHKFTELDHPGEWIRDWDEPALLLWLPNSDVPDPHLIEVKRRTHALDLSNRAYITIKGLRIFAADIISNASSHHLVLDGINAKYVSHFTVIKNNPYLAGTTDTGIVLNGSDDVLENSRISFSAGNGVTLLGANHRVTNNFIHDVNYAAVYCATISSRADTRGMDIRYNTLYNSGRDLLTISGLAAGKIQHNEFYGSGQLRRDQGAVYTYGSDGQGTEISYNLIHDITDLANLGHGIYLDNGSKNYSVHHNLVWNTDIAQSLNSPSINNLIYNNTLFARRYSINSYVRAGETQDLTGTRVVNNIFNMPTRNVPTSMMKNNLGEQTTLQFVDAAKFNFQLRATSPAIDAGIPLAPYTDSFIGTAPDLGAFEFGVTPWSAGAKK